ncbi:hypothetical protein SAMN05421640_2543 [Ekhidna lutea]|uniref:Uncharacterized protein n=1 Tax=Ekhidna lutea TaxID=447679 RepID=A0A239KCC8_EKHLU|nr:hypothetical protein [Ekhidna lutea]SNT15352.1 hypothetical protein SAMN05421640_2543 [Ekhidna lutea]
MEEKNLRWKDYHHQLYQIYHGIIALTLVPFALLFLEWDSGGKMSQHSTLLGYVFMPIILSLTAFAIWYAYKGPNVRYQLSEEMTLNEKLKEFKKKNLYKYFILAIAGILSALAMWIVPSFIYVIIYFAVLVQYSFLRPSEDKIVRDMRLSKEDRKVLHQNK